MISYLLPSLYTAPTAGWTPFLEALRHHFAASQAMLSFVDYRSGQMRAIAHHVGFTQQQEAEFRAKWAHHDPWLQRAPAQLPLGAVRASHELCPDEILETLPVYREFLGPNGWHYGAGVIVTSQPGLEGTLTFVRPKQRGKVTPAELAHLAALQPHITGVAELDLRLRTLELRAQVSERLPYGYALLDHRNAVLYANPIARQLLPQVKLAPRPAPLESRYAPELGCWLIVRRFEGPPPGAEIAMLRPSDPWQVDAAQLRTIFDLTQAEARFTALLCGGRTLAEVAAELGIASSTARTHLKRVLSKTQCHRQAELVALVLRLG